MAVTTISPKYQVVIPKAVRDELGLMAGQKVQVMAYKDRIELIPLKPIKDLKGFLPDLGTAVPRDADRL